MKTADRKKFYNRVSQEYNAANKQIFGGVSREGKIYNAPQSVGPRVFNIFSDILSELENKQHVRIGNFSGLNYACPDLVLVKLLSEYVGRERFEWTAYDHRLSSSFTNPICRQMIAEAGIALKEIDYREIATTQEITETYDIILSTEIIEHLDHFTLFNMFHFMLKSMNADGVVIMTTPNPVYLLDRIRILLGSWDYQFFNDENKDYEAGHFGHINYYDIARLSRLMRSVGFDIKNSFTFNSNHGLYELKLSNKLVAEAVRFLSRFIPNSRQVIYIAATSGAR